MTAPSIVYFGDSLSDDGNLYDYGEGLLPDEIRDAISGPTHAVSDGPTHVTHTTDLLAVETANYAVAAAEAIGSQTLEEMVIESGYDDDLLVPITDPALDLDINLGAQVDRFLADYAGEDMSRTTAFLMIGGNDFQNLDYSSPTLIRDAEAMVMDIFDAMMAAVGDLAAAGVTRFILADMPQPLFFPSAASFSLLELNAAEAVFDQLNNLLYAAEIASGGPQIDVARQFHVTDAIIDDPTAFGLLAPYTDTILYSDATDHFDPDQIAFYDDIHPSTATHGVLGAFHAVRYENGGAVTGNAGDDQLFTTNTSNPAPWTMFGQGGNDLLTTENTHGAIMVGGTGHDTLEGGDGVELMSGGAENDLAFGRAGDDVINGGLGRDRSFGGSGDDVLIDSLGSDGMRGGLGDDTFIFTEPTLLGGTRREANWIKGGTGEDTLWLVLTDATHAAIDQLLQSGDTEAALASLGLVVQGSRRSG